MSPMPQIRKDVFRLSQAEFAAVAGVSQATVSRWEAGKWEPSRDELARIRAQAMQRGLVWDDRFFFEAASIGCDTRPARSAA